MKPCVHTHTILFSFARTHTHTHRYHGIEMQRARAASDVVGCSPPLRVERWGMFVHQGGGWLIDRTRFSTRPAEPRHSFHPEPADPLGRACSPTRSQRRTSEGLSRRRRGTGEYLDERGINPAFSEMTYNWAWLLLFSLVSIGTCLPIEDVKKVDQVMKPKSKRAQEMLMFGNQQNRRANAASESFTSNAEKRTLASSGLGSLKAALAEETNSKPTQPKSSSSNAMYEQETYAPYDASYDYGKVLVNEVEEDGPRVWDVPPYSRYYTSEDRRKRSEKSTATARPATTLQPPTSSYQTPTPTQQPVQAQVKRSIPFYQEPRYKRELPLDIDPEDVLAILSLWENERRNGNWRKYANEEYENIMDDNGLLADEEDPRNALPWLDTPVYPSRHYAADTLSPSDIGIVRTHPPSYYEQLGNQLDQQYGGTTQYGNPQYGSSQYGNSQYGFVYPQRAYYPQEKRFMVSKKRSQSYDPYSAAQLQLSSQPRSYQYPHRVVY